jgi:hypothetical protein
MRDPVAATLQRLRQRTGARQWHRQQANRRRAPLVQDLPPSGFGPRTPPTTQTRWARSHHPPLELFAVRAAGRRSDRSPALRLPEVASHAATATGSDCTIRGMSKQTSSRSKGDPNSVRPTRRRARLGRHDRLPSPRQIARDVFAATARRPRHSVYCQCSSKVSTAMSWSALFLVMEHLLTVTLERGGRT